MQTIKFHQNTYGLIDVSINNTEEKEYTYLQLVQKIKTFTDTVTITYPSGRAAIRRRIERLLAQEEIETTIKWHQSNESTIEKSNSFIQGVMCSFSGIYPDHLRHVGIKHLLYGEREKNDYPILPLEYSAVNSSIIIEHKKIALPDMGLRTLVVKEKEIIEIDQDNNTKQVQAIQRITFSSLIEMKEVGLKSTQLLVDFPDIKDTKLFIETFQLFYYTGVISSKFLLATYQNECVWLSKPACTLGEFTRLNYSCHKKGAECFSLSKKKTERVDLSEEKACIQQQQLQKMIKNDCFNCPVKDTCNQCLVMLSSEKGPMYCKVKKEYPQIEQMIQLKNILKSLINYLMLIDKKTVYQELILDFPQPNLEKKGIPSMILCRYAEKYYMIDCQKMSFFSVKKPDYRQIVNRLLERGVTK